VAVRAISALSREAIPKSVTFTWSVEGLMMMLAGLRSLWMIWASWISCSAVQSCVAIRRKDGRSSRVVERNSAKDVPPKSSWMIAVARGCFSSV
jgi:hypothetical protein